MNKEAEQNRSPGAAAGDGGCASAHPDAFDRRGD
jgi:hypothetical protein